MKFTWNEDKSLSNRRKHGISFEVATLVFEDPDALSVRDELAEDERWITVGCAKGVVLILVVHTFTEGEDNEEIIRIISARKATPRERESYEQQHDRP